MRDRLAETKNESTSTKIEHFATIGKACPLKCCESSLLTAKGYRRQDISSAEDRKVRPEPTEGEGYPSRALLFPGRAPEPLWMNPETAEVVAE